MRLERLGEKSLVQATLEPDNYWQFLEDRRDDRFYWISRDYEGESIVGPGTSTDHERDPIMKDNVERGYDESATTRFG